MITSLYGVAVNTYITSLPNLTVNYIKGAGGAGVLFLKVLEDV